jgi:hypothetical protein
MNWIKRTTIDKQLKKLSKMKTIRKTIYSNFHYTVNKSIIFYIPLDEN